jgi:hypothetical protein
MKNVLQWREHYRIQMGINRLIAYVNHEVKDVERVISDVRRQYPLLGIEEATGRALARLDALVHHANEKNKPVPIPEHNYKKELRFIGGLLVIIAFLLAANVAHCQVTAIKGTTKGTTPAGQVTATSADANHTGLDVICVSGCAGSSGATTPTNAFANPTTAGMAMSFNAMWNGTSWDLVKGDTTSGLWVNCKSGCAGGTSTPTNAFANPTTAGLSMSFNMMWNGATWDLVKGDTTNGLWVNCKNGCAGGSSTPTDTFANPTTAGLNQGFMMMWNGTTWDRVKGDTTSGVWTNVKSLPALVAGSAVIGHVIVDTTSTTAVTQATGTNLHAVIDTGSTTAVTQATGTNLHAVTDTGSVTAASNFPTTVDTNSGVKSASTLRVVLATDQPALTNKLLVTPDSVALPANQSVNVSQINAVTPLMGNGVTGTGSQRVTIASDNTAFSVNAVESGTWTVQPGNTANSTPWLTTDSATSATGSAPPAKAAFVGFLGSGATGGLLTGAPVGDTYKNISVSTATTTLLVTGVAGRQVRITAMHMVTAAANNVALIEGTGATCGTGSAGMAGGTTAASGYNFAANGGMTIGAGLGTVMQTATTGDSVCVVTSAATQLSGGLEYTIY